MNKNHYLTKDDRYDIDYEFGQFRQMLLRYNDFFIDKNIILMTTDFGVLTLFLKEKNKKVLTTFDYNFIK